MSRALEINTWNVVLCGGLAHTQALHPQPTPENPISRARATL